MLKSPKISEIKKWLEKNNPLELFRDKNFAIKDIDPKPWSGHFNYLVKSGHRKFVLRFKGSEWGEPERGIVDEFKILKYVEKYRVAPRAYYLTRNFFGEPALFEEYFEGKIFTAFPWQEQEKLLPQVARFIARINKISFRKNALPFQEAMTSYRKNKKTWRERLNTILRNRGTRSLGKKIERILPQAEKALQGYEECLGRVLRRSRPVFIFESAHPGHLLKTKRGFRFLNWEQVSFGDPAYTIAVFLVSFASHRDFSEIKNKMIQDYLKVNYILELEKLIEGRLKEREISNLIWGPWAHVRRLEAGLKEKGPDVSERFERVKKILTS